MQLVAVVHVVEVEGGSCAVEACVVGRGLERGQGLLLFLGVLIHRISKRSLYETKINK